MQLVTGAGGFIGGHLVAALRQRVRDAPARIEALGARQASVRAQPEAVPRQLSELPTEALTELLETARRDFQAALETYRQRRLSVRELAAPPPADHGQADVALAAPIGPRSELPEDDVPAALSRARRSLPE